MWSWQILSSAVVEEAGQNGLEEPAPPVPARVVRDLLRTEPADQRGVDVHLLRRDAPTSASSAVTCTTNFSASA